MTIITEYRLKCDYCQNISPVVGLAELAPGWVTNVTFIDPKGTRFAMLPADKHFCCDNHRQQWEKLQEDK